MNQKLSKLQQRNMSLCSDVSDLCKPLFENSDISSFNYIQQYANGSRKSLCNRPDWLENFLIKQYYLQSPIHNPDFRSDNFALWDCFRENCVIQDADENFNLSHGITLFNNQKSYIEIMHFATTRDKESIVNWYINNLDLLKRFGLFFRNEAEELINKSLSTSPVHHKPIEPQELENLSKSSLLAKTKLNSWKLGQEYNNAELSKREVACLYGIIHGKTSKQIAQEINISPRTVEAYTIKLKKKFNAYSKSDLVKRVLTTNFLADFSHGI